jgi:hypothetical protein
MNTLRLYLRRGAMAALLAYGGVSPVAHAAIFEYKASTGLVVGNSVWQLGKSLKSGGGWLALACSPSECALEPARLRVKADKRSISPGMPAVAGQNLIFSRVADSTRTPVAWLRRAQLARWDKPRPVVSWGSAMGGLGAATGDGSLEIEVGPPGQSKARFVPMLDRENSQIVLQLRSGPLRQQLGTMAACQASLNTGYLLWAGDMDGDGRGDYLVKFPAFGQSGNVVLYLSSKAAPGELVGEGPTFAAITPPGQCEEIN